MAGRFTVLSLLFLVPCLCLAQPAGKTDSAAADSPATDSLATVSAFLKPVLIDHLPNPLYEKSTNWGNQSMTAHHVEWRGIRPRVVKVPRNDGTWRKVRITTRNAASTLDLKLSDLKSDGAERQTFKGQLSLLVGVEVEQQIWEGGVRLYSGSLKARLKLKLAMDCETTLHLEEGKSLLPDATFRARVLSADVSYDDLVVEHVAGVGGTGAKLMGDVLHSALKQWRPSLEREFLAKANAAIVKAADTKEIKLSLGKLFETKPHDPAKKSKE